MVNDDLDGRHKRTGVVLFRGKFFPIKMVPFPDVIVAFE